MSIYSEGLAGSSQGNDNNLIFLPSTEVGKVDVNSTGDQLVFRSDFDVTGDPACASQVGKAIALHTSGAKLVAVDFALAKGNCQRISGSYIRLHYNRSLLATDVYFIDLKIHSNTLPSGFSYRPNAKPEARTVAL